MAEAVIKQDGIEKTLSFEPGILLSELLRINSHDFELPCGGAGTCLRCRVKAWGELSKPTEDEKRVFGEKGLSVGWRLVCRTSVLGGVTVVLDPALKMERILTTGDSPDFIPDPVYNDWGAAVDIGTTTIAACLYRRADFAGSASVKNPQAIIGADVVTRIGKALEGQDEELAVLAANAIVELLEALARKNKIGISDIGAVVLTGNTAMLHLFLRENAEPLSHAPFDVKRLFGEMLRAVGLLAGMPETKLYLPRCVSAFVGADTTTAVLASGMCRQNETAVLMDIGTNGEIALWHGGELFCCSTAAGPAFEGGGVSMGVCGVNGAVDKVWLEDEDGALSFSTIGGGTPVGICGSGIVDAVAVMLELGIIDETGAFRDRDDVFFAAPGISLTGRDVRMVQLAKGSMRAGLETLLKTAGADKPEVAALYIAGGFGNYLNLNNAAAIGLVPGELLSVTKVIGNAALSGASMILRNRDFAEESAAVVANARIVPLESDPLFMDLYMQYMCFGDE